MKKYIIVITVLTLLAFISSCGGDPTLPAEGTITILSVTPDSGLLDNTPTDFTVEVEYSLLNSAQGELDIGFNNGDSINSYYMSSVDHIVTEGSGTYIFNVNETTKDWGVEGDFEVYVNIVGYPHESSYSPLDSDWHTLSF